MDLEARLVERCTPVDERPEVLTEQLEWQPSAENAPLAIDLPALFSEILDD